MLDIFRLIEERIPSADRICDRLVEICNQEASIERDFYGVRLVDYTDLISQIHQLGARAEALGKKTFRESSEETK